MIRTLDRLRLLLGAVAAAVVFLAPLHAPAVAQVATSAAAPLSTDPRAVMPRTKGWAQLAGDLPVDPDVTLGVLPNGMRYLIHRSDAQKGRAALRMVIIGGSMNEAPDQAGLAHFLEHMAFHGSKRVGDGEMQKSLERLGLRFGADTNASTGPDRTIYQFNLARNDDASLDEGLLLFREIGSELNLDPALMEKERGVILAEIRMREQPMQVFQQQLAKRLIGDHPFGLNPGGRPEVIQTAPITRMRAFYDAYYRPERAVVVVAGDIDPKAIEAKIKAKFSDWAGRGPAGGDPDPLMTKPEGPQFLASAIPGMPLATLQLNWFEPYHPNMSSRADRRRLLVEQLGSAAMQSRMSAIVEDAGRPSTQIGAIGSNNIVGVMSGWNMAASGVNDAPKTLALMISTLRQVRTHGVTQAELDQTIESRRAGLKRAAAAGNTAPAEAVAGADAQAAGNNASFLSAQQNLDLFEEQVKAITLADVNAALTAAGPGEPQVTYFGPADLRGGVDALKAAYDAAMKAPVSTYAVAEVKPWPYTDFGKPGKVIERSQPIDIGVGEGVTFVRFANGVRLTILPTQLRRNEVLVTLRFGNGRLGMPRDKMTASDMGEWIWSSGGLRKLTRPEQQQTLRTEAVGVSSGQADDAYELRGRVTPERLDRQLQLMTAMFTDPAWRTDEWDDTMRRADEGDKSVPFTAAGVAGQNLDVLTHSGDIRWKANDSALRHSWKPADAIAFMKPIVATAPIELIVVGDVKMEEVVASVAKTVGALPKRSTAPEPKGLRNVSFPKGTPTPLVLTHKGPSTQGLVFVYWPTNDIYADPRAHRVRNVLASIMRSRAFDKIRNSDGKSYSPQQTVWGERVLPGYGYLGLQVDAPPEAAEAVFASIDAIAQDLQTHPVPEDEFKRTIGPLLESARAQRQENGFWMTNLENAQTDPRVLAYQRSSIADYQSITPDDVMAAARKWLQPKTAWRLKVVPEGK